MFTFKHEGGVGSGHKIIILGADPFYIYIKRDHLTLTFFKIPDVKKFDTPYLRAGDWLPLDATNFLDFYLFQSHKLNNNLQSNKKLLSL